MSQVNALQSFIQTLRQINLAQPEENIITRVSPLLKHCITNPNAWFEDRFYEVDEEQGFGSHLLYENPDHTLAVILTSWPTRRETPPHDHDTWAVIGCVYGCENNIFWNRHDDRSNPNFAHITRGKMVTCYPGDIVAMKTNDIHSVVNPENEGISISLHVYGKHFNYTNRKKFDPEKKTVQPFFVRQVPAGAGVN